MRLTKKLKAEILTIYLAYWDSFFKGDMRAFASALDESVQIIGSSENEIFSSKASAVKFYKATAGQVAGKTGLQNRNIRMRAFENSVMITERSDFYALIDGEWTFYGHGRISTLMRKTGRAWKVIYEHGSLPDAKAGAGEQINTERIKAENLQLREAVKRRTIELEQKNRELEIEAALERVRARAMSMHRSAELAETAAVMFREFRKLTNIELGTGTGCWISIIDTENEIAENWGTDFEGDTLPVRFRLPQTEHPVLAKNFEAYKRGEPLIVTDLSRAAFIDFTQYISRLPDFVTDPVIQKAIADPPQRYLQYEASFSHGAVGIGSVHPLEKQDTDILLRFAKVFEMTYRRFLDLKQAEEQAREAQIEAALERVRARTMGMHKSDELRSVIAMVFEQLKGLGFEAPACGLIIFQENGDAVNWLSGFGKEIFPVGYHIPHFDHPYYQAWLDAWKSGEPWKDFVVEGELKRSFDQHLFQHSDFKNLPDEIKGEFGKIDRAVSSNAFMTHGMLGILANEPIAEEQKNIIKRFAKVFDQTYTRFLDLKNAEAQARESEIQLALERVRARTMAMHQSDELSAAAMLMFRQVEALGIKTWACGFNIWDRDDAATFAWMSSPQGDFNPPFRLPHSKNAHLKRIYAARDKEALYVEEQSGKKLTQLFQYLTSLPEFQAMVDKTMSAGMPLPEFLVSHNAYFSRGYLAFITLEPYPEAWDIFKRFARVFEQTYTRFLDLQKAEAQAREAQIEAALERVRARAMAMHSSEDLSNTVNVFFGELKNLGITPIRCGVAEVNEETRSWTLAATSASQQGEAFEILGGVKRLDHPVLENIYKHWQLQKEYYPVLQGAELKAYYKVLRPQLAIPDFLDETKHYGNYFYFKEGFVFALTEREMSGEQVRIFRRFTSVLSLTYRRYMDLKEAEARAREAEQQASLDRVRAEIASMRSADDLQRIIPLVWRELNTLGVPFFRCGVFIIDEVAEQAQVYLSTPSGEAVAALHLKYDRALVIAAAVQHWRQQQVYREEWNREQFIAWTQSILKQGLIDSPEKYQAGGEAPGKLVLHFVPFTQGMLYVGSSVALCDDEIARSQSLAKAFGMAYARYEDFQRLEAAKAQVEAALESLKKTQSQLVQAEKLASLGQLTAGIAHEIKNPLNFVNNFAVLSMDLVKELRDEIVKIEDGGLRIEASGSGIVERESLAKIEDRGLKIEDRRSWIVGGEKLTSMKEILKTLEQNAEKINHHGRRADDVVRAMMQHARGGKGERQPTDLNALVEEYLNLTYHGMRAKVPDFNVSIERDFGDLDGKIEMVPQDIGRVLLNLLSNAFDAVRDKAQSAEGAYVPSVMVSTRAVAGAVEIRVRDNGSGISDEVREKVFEPFFTSKPAGSGTGLGLSLSYDIIKQGHGGRLTFESTKGEGATFIITLPAK